MHRVQSVPHREQGTEHSQTLGSLASARSNSDSKRNYKLVQATHHTHANERNIRFQVAHAERGFSTTTAPFAAVQTGIDASCHGARACERTRPAGDLLFRLSCFRELRAVGRPRLPRRSVWVGTCVGFGVVGVCAVCVCVCVCIKSSVCVSVVRPSSSVGRALAF